MGEEAGKATVGAKEREEQQMSRKRIKKEVTEVLESVRFKKRAKGSKNELEPNQAKEKW